eukprot:ctg_1766.g541
MMACARRHRRTHHGWTAKSIRWDNMKHFQETDELPALPSCIHDPRFRFPVTLVPRRSLCHRFPPPAFQEDAPNDEPTDVGARHQTPDADVQDADDAGTAQRRYRRQRHRVSVDFDARHRQHAGRRAAQAAEHVPERGRQARADIRGHFQTRRGARAVHARRRGAYRAGGEGYGSRRRTAAGIPDDHRLDVVGCGQRQC